MRKASILIVFFAAVFRNVYQITLTSLPRPHPSAPPEIKEFGANGVLHIEPKQLLVNVEKACGRENEFLRSETFWGRERDQISMVFFVASD